MRQIKFRAWNKDTKMWVSNENEQSQTKLNYDTNYLVSWHVYELMQFTGLKDKNGKEIYEGDIVKLIPIEEHKKDLHMVGIREVYFGSDNATFYYSEFIPMAWGGFESVEIIGNIHESPELLK